MSADVSHPKQKHAQNAGIRRPTTRQTPLKRLNGIEKSFLFGRVAANDIDGDIVERFEPRAEPGVQNGIAIQKIIGVFAIPFVLNPKQFGDEPARSVADFGNIADE